ncbi:SIMPL domain-containing protein [Flavobacterium proteolyticum]|uniref:SIMPL domain-containing protein n=1 Tax=Flavobacterium proteolyticum TaxID=2911683 RepID=A0ABR9WSX5_9FLAO|nr:SIMPL domain-containing protein [Flavobacterium proteolyticum]MBE9576749.1 SIMPL domain-containing protein [Flavobacterium proteolyticum]
MKTQVSYLNGKIKWIIVALVLTFGVAQAQISGNQIYGNNRYNENNYNQNGLPNNTVVSINDNHLTVTVKMLLNKKADGFVITLGLNQEDETVSGCSKKINTRIDGFLDKIKVLGIKKENCYIDFISQTKIYDFNANLETAQQIDKGFEIKKNIIITTSNANSLEKLITIASEFEIHDIIKVEYFNNDTNAIHNSLFDEALVLAEAKKIRYMKSFGKRVIGTPSATEEFATVFPKTQYKMYQAFESAEIETNYNNRNQYLKKIARKNKTFYYDGISSAGFDKVINPNQTEVGIQYVLTLTMTYKIDTSI